MAAVGEPPSSPWKVRVVNTPKSPSAGIARELLAALALAALVGIGTWLVFGPGATPIVDRDAGGYTAAAYPVMLGCGVVLPALTVAATFVVRPLLVVPAVALPFTAAWTAGAASVDESGLWAVGAVIALIGSTVGAVIVSVLADSARKYLV